jgi:ribosome-binding protein aMBF1 (putative translation factor)
MIKKTQINFYTQVGRALTAARRARNMSIQQLANRSGEQNKTIRAIEAGNGQCSLHHLIWMRDVLGMDLNQLTEGNSGEEDKLRGITTEFCWPDIDDII